MIRNFAHNNRQIEYTLRISSRAKRISVNIKYGEVTLVVPKNVSIDYAERFLKRKGDWIVKHLDNAANRPKGLYYLGKKMKAIEQSGVLEFVESQNETLEHADLHKEYFEMWMFAKAKNYIPLRTAELAHQYNFSFNRITVKKVRSRWGSCSSKKNLSFNYKLMQFRKGVIDYVIIHELAHTLQMNHSKKFWSIVESIIPEYKELKKELRNGKTM